MYDTVDSLMTYAESLCLNDDELNELHNTWGIDKIFNTILEDRKNNYKFYDIFEPVLYKNLACILYPSLGGIFYKRSIAEHETNMKNIKGSIPVKEWDKQYRTGFMTAEKTRTKMQKDFDKVCGIERTFDL